jgi:hypothetical protein
MRSIFEALLAFVFFCLGFFAGRSDKAVLGSERDPAPPERTARIMAFPGNAHDRRLVRRQHERAAKVGPV